MNDDNKKKGKPPSRDRIPRIFGNRTSDCSSSSGSLSSDQANIDYQDLLKDLSGGGHDPSLLDELRSACGDEAKALYDDLRKQVKRINPDRLDALKRLYDSRKQQ